MHMAARIPLDPVRTSSDEDEVDVVKTPKGELPPYQTAVINGLRKMVEKVGGHIGNANELSYLHMPVGYVSTGIWGLDNLLTEGGGVPLGRIIEVFAPESVGKSALAEYLMGCFHREGGNINYIDTEKTRDDERIEHCYGVKPDDFLDPDLPDLEAAWDFIRGTLKIISERQEIREAKKMEPEPPNLTIVDSVAGTPSREELAEKEHDDSHIGLQARANSKGTRVVVRKLSTSPMSLIFINQIRDVIGSTGFGPKTQTPGGRALKFAYSIRLKLARIESLKKGEVDIGHIVQVQSVKNKFAPPHMKTEIVLSYRRGIDANWSNFRWLQEHRVIAPKGEAGFALRLGNKKLSESFRRSEFSTFYDTNKDVIDPIVKQIQHDELAATRASNHKGDE